MRRSLSLKSGRLRFWNDWYSSFIDDARFTGHLHKYVPWKRLKKRELVAFFDDVFEELAPAAEKWSIYFTIHGLDYEHNLERIHGITLYDPKAYDFRNLGFLKVDSSKATTRAKVDVIASGYFDASRLAWRKLAPMLDRVAFILSLNRSYGGFAVEIDPYVFAEKVRTQSAIGGTQLDRNDRPLRQQTGTAVQNFVGTRLDGLTARILKGAKLSELEERFTAAVHWYNKGRWQRDPADTYLFYWIGMETLFGGVQQKQLFNEVSMLCVSWQTVLGYSWYFLQRHHADLTKKLADDPQMGILLMTEPKLKGWDTNYKPLMNHKNVQRLISLIPESKEEVRSYASGYLDHLLGLVSDRSAFESELKTQRDEFVFKLYLLKALRNDVTHGGVHEHPNFKLFANELQRIFEGLLQLTGNGINNYPRKYTTIDALSRGVNDWWVR